MPQISWLKIREWNGSKADAFEEFCRQLAHSEPMPAGARFIPKGKPDSGLECFWVLENGDEWGWQAKFFPDGLNSGRWEQCDESVKKALEGHPRLKKFHLCVPCEFPDARKSNQMSSFVLWERHRTKWADWANQKGMTVEFVAWTEHELLQRLTNPMHRGRMWFWFNEPPMDDDWFRKNVKDAVSLADERYSPDLHLDVPEARYFDALARNTAFFSDLEALGIKLSDIIKKFAVPHTENQKPIADIRQSLYLPLEKINSCLHDLKTALDFDGLNAAASASDALTQDEVRKIWASRREEVAQFEKEHGRRPEYYEIDKDGSLERQLRDTSSALREIVRFCTSIFAKLANNPSVILVGEAGLGKTHLLCAVAEKFTKAKKSVVLLLGQQFNCDEPWTQIIKNLGLTCDRDQFLGGLEAAGEAAGTRTLILIDAINDGSGIRFWKNRLGAMLSQLKSFPHVGLALTVRTAYFDRDYFSKQPIFPIELHGFADQPIEATRHFFKHYGLDEPNFPMLAPEFNNPLLLKLICRALKAAGRKTLSADLVGVSAIFGFVLNEIEARLADKLDYPRSSKLVLKSVNRLAELMADAEREVIPLEVAMEELGKICPANGYSNSMLWHLIAEHVVARFPGTPDGDKELIRFTYQRFSDHMIVKNVLARTPKNKLKELTKPDGIFPKPENSHDWYYYMPGWIEALAIQLPETHQMEIDELFPVSWDNETLRLAFLTSLIWRRTNAFSPATAKRVKKLFDGEHCWELLDAVIAVAAKPGHPFNGDWLDSILRSQTMSERDRWWSTYLFGKNEDDGNLRRLIEWAWAERKEENYSEETVRLAAVTLTWCLTTSDRFVRDRATKALVSLLENHVAVLQRVLAHFAPIAEPYLQERLFAVAYGCAMLTRQKKELKGLAQYVYNRIFAGGRPPPSLLLRDHARGVIEKAVRAGLSVDHVPSLILPPYRSAWPNEPPSMGELEKLFQTGNWDDGVRSLKRIFDSVTSDDFSHYAIFADWWSNRRRKGKSDQSPKNLYDKLLRSLSEHRAGAVAFYAECLERIETPRPYETNDPRRKAELQRWVNENEPIILGFFSEAKAKTFRDEIVPFLKDPGFKNHQRVFSEEMLRRLILNRVLQLGWTVERFNDFDLSVPEKGRDAHKAERIGKKYQWIAYDEIIARISDNFGLAETSTTVMDSETEADGTWTNRFRNLDPSLLLRGLPKEKEPENKKAWWMPDHYEGWDSASTPVTWLQKTDDIPDPKAFFSVRGPDETIWMALDTYKHWKKTESFGSFQGEIRDSQELHFIIRSYPIFPK
jgi:hypothetical protein